MRLHSPTDPGPKGPPASPERIDSALAEIYANLARTRARSAGLDEQQQEEAGQKAIAAWRERRAVYLQPPQHPGRGNRSITNRGSFTR